MIAPLLMMMLGCPKPVLPPTVPAVMPETTRSPYDDPSKEPALQGDITGTVLFEADLAVMDEVNPGNWNQIFGHLAADPGWRLCEYDQAIVAFKRREGEVPRSGFHPDGYRELLRFTAWDRELPWAASERITRVPASQATFEAQAFDGRVAVVIEGLDLSLELHEALPPENTADALSSRGAHVRHMLDTEATPAGEPAEPSLAITAVEGGLDIRGWVNAGTPGWVWVRLADEAGDTFEGDGVAIATREAVGWSAEPGEVFSMQGVVPLPPGTGFRGTAEVWVRSAMGEDALVPGFEVTVPARD